MRNRQTSALLSLLIHAAAALLLLTVATNPKGIIRPLRAGSWNETKLIEPYLPKKGGGGGGGDHSLLRASKGALPKAAARQFTPPQVVQFNPEPKLIMEPTIVVAVNT